MSGRRTYRRVRRRVTVAFTIVTFTWLALSLGLAQRHLDAPLPPSVASAPAAAAVEADTAALRDRAPPPPPPRRSLSSMSPPVPSWDDVFPPPQLPTGGRVGNRSDGGGIRSSPTARAPELCVVARTFVGHRSSLLPFASSLAAGRPPRMRVILVDTDPRSPFDDIHGVAEWLNDVLGAPRLFTVSARNASAAAEAFPRYKGPDYGYIMTDLVLEDLLAERRDAAAAGVAPGDLPCEVLLVTNGDNIYHALFLRETLPPLVRDGLGLVATHFVSHYDWPGGKLDEPMWEKVRLHGQCGPWRPGRDVEVATALRPACVDLGAVLFRTSLLESSPPSPGARTRFIVDRLRLDGEGLGTRGLGMNAGEADGELFQSLALRPGVKSLVVRRTLLLHQ